MIINFLSNHRYFFTRKFPKIYVNLAEFKKNHQKLLNEIYQIGATPIIINIMKPNRWLINRSYDILKNVKKYNKVLLFLSKKNNCPLIDVYSMIESDKSLRWEDGIHLTTKGHEELTKRLIPIINSKLEF